jgi:hypothetical protein
MIYYNNRWTLFGYDLWNLLCDLFVIQPEE